MDEEQYRQREVRFRLCPHHRLRSGVVSGPIHRSGRPDVWLIDKTILRSGSPITGNPDQQIVPVCNVSNGHWKISFLVIDQLFIGVFGLVNGIDGLHCDRGGQ
jgi:hypothetical protein